MKKAAAVILSICLVLSVLPACFVSAQSYSDMIVIEKDFVGSKWETGAGVIITFKLYSYGDYTAQNYYVNIYNDKYQKIISKSGEFDCFLGVTDYVVNMPASLCASGIYYAECYSTKEQSTKGTYYPFYCSTYVKNPSLTLSASSVKVKAGGSADVYANVTGDVTWYSPDRSTVTVSNGHIEAFKEGTVDIFAEWKKYGATFRAYCTVKIGLYSDVFPSDWFYGAVKFASDKGYFKGNDNGVFGAGDGIQRQDFIVVLARIDGVDLEAYKEPVKNFPDVIKNSYFEKAVNWAVKNEITTGYDDGRFGVGDQMTREQLVTLLYRYAQYKKFDVSATDEAAKKYSDYETVSAFAKESICWAVSKGVIGGMDAAHIGPQGSASRAQVAQILKNVSEKGVLPI